MNWIWGVLEKQGIFRGDATMNSFLFQPYPCPTCKIMAEQNTLNYRNGQIYTASLWNRMCFELTRITKSLTMACSLSLSHPVFLGSRDVPVCKLSGFRCNSCFSETVSTCPCECPAPTEPRYADFPRELGQFAGYLTLRSGSVKRAKVTPTSFL